MPKSWKKEQMTYLKRYAKTKTLAELAKRFGRPEEDVLAKLEELHLATADGKGYEEPWVDPLLDIFEEGLKAFHEEKWKQAAGLFEKVAAETDQPEIASRARIYHGLTQERLEPVSEDSDDPFLEAVVAKNEGNLEEAASICSLGGRRMKDERFAYLAASICALEGDHEEAMNLLEVAIELNPKNRVHAYHDPDFDTLRSESAFAQLFEAS